MGIKQCVECGSFFQTDLRGGAKRCFPCKAVVNKEYRRDYKRRNRALRILEAGREGVCC